MNSYGWAMFDNLTEMFLVELLLCHDSFLFLCSYPYDQLFPAFASGTWLPSEADASDISSEMTVVQKCTKSADFLGFLCSVVLKQHFSPSPLLLDNSLCFLACFVWEFDKDCLQINRTTSRVFLSEKSMNKCILWLK